MGTSHGYISGLSFPGPVVETVISILHWELSLLLPVKCNHLSKSPYTTKETSIHSDGCLLHRVHSVGHLFYTV
jgi:hypothetical protein